MEQEDMKDPEWLLPFNPITEKIIGCGFRVSNGLGHGFLEKVYENSLVHDMRKSGLMVVQQQPLKVTYDGVIVGDYVADILVEGCVLVELKAVRALDNVHMAQCLNYMKATGIRVCLLMNFGSPKLEWKRILL